MGWNRIGAAVPLLAMAGCAWQGPSLGGVEGAQFPVTSYYANNAIENNMYCTSPAMTPVRAQIVADDGKQVQMLVRYHWYPDNFKGRSVDPNGNRSSSDIGLCNGWSERTFTLARTTDGGLQVVKMTGPQRS